MRTLSVIAFSVTALINFDSAVGTPSASEIYEITLERTSSSCGAPCPDYKLAVRRDGPVEYEGREFVNVKGIQRSTISLADFERIASKVRAIHFFDLRDKYDSLEIGGSALFVTDQPTQIVTVKAGNRTKRIEDYFGTPRGLRELEDLIEQVTNSSKWTGMRPGFADIPYYDAFPLNRRLTFRALLEHYSKADAPSRIAGYQLMFLKNNGVSFNVEPRQQLDLSRFDGYIVDATGYIEDRPKSDFVFVATKIRPVRRYLDIQPAPNG